MDTGNNPIIRRPQSPFPADMVDSYFYIETTASELSRQPELIIPFPRITFAYFFDHPIAARNHTLGKSALVDVMVSKISTHKVSVHSRSDNIKILGAHLKPFGLAYLTEQPINSLPWLIDAEVLFGNITTNFIRKINSGLSVAQMVDEAEKVFLDNLLERDLSLITAAIDMIEKQGGNIEVSELSERLEVSDRTIRNHFYKHIGCAPKAYLRIVKLKQIVHQLNHSESPLTHIAHENNFFDQAHFIREVKDITGQSPKQLRRDIPTFRFLQF